MTAEDPFYTFIFTLAHGEAPATISPYGTLERRAKLQSELVVLVGFDRVNVIGQKLLTCYYLAGLPPNLVRLDIGGYGAIGSAEIGDLSVFLSWESRSYLAADNTLWAAMRLICFDSFVKLNVFEDALDLIYPLVLQLATEEEP